MNPHSFVAFLSQCGPVTLQGRKPRSSAYPKDLKTLGDHIRQRRLELGLTQLELAEKLGVSEATVVNWETNRGMPNRSHRLGILRFVSARKTRAP